MDDLDIPEFLRRPYVKSTEQKRSQATHARGKRIPYPPDGYLGKGLRKAARERLRETRRRRAEKCRER